MGYAEGNEGSSVTDDPREILKAAGVERAEVEVYRLAADRWEVDSHDNGDESVNAADAAILALAQLVAKYKWAAEGLQTELLQAALDHGFSIPTLAARLAEYEAGHV